MIVPDGQRRQSTHRFAKTNRRSALAAMGMGTSGALGATLLGDWFEPIHGPWGLASAHGQELAGATSRLARAVVDAEHRWAAASVHPLATRAAVDAFGRGGNAIDAAVAASFMLGVVDGHNSGIGGGCFILVRTGEGKFVAIDGREMAPGKSHRDMYIRDGKPQPALSQTGPLASGVPGQVAALHRLSQEHGRGDDWSRGLLDAAAMAQGGYAIGGSTAAAIRSTAAKLARFPASAAQFLTDDGRAPAEGDLLVQADLAATLESLATQGPGWFYTGPFAAACERWMRDNGGILTADDFAAYRVKNREPLKTSYRQWRIVGFPPPSSGGIHVAQMLTMLESFDVRRLLNDDPAAGAHLIAEVMKRAFADRAHWLGDSDFAAVPRGLIDRDYCRRLGSSIDLSRATTVDSHGRPPRADADLFSQQHTTHLTTADAEGNWVAITQTVNTNFGSGVVIPGTGVVMNNEMDDFSISPGTPNAFGLVGAEANAIAPGKRPLSSMSPTIVTDGRGIPRMTCGAAGGPRIISAVLQCLIGVLDRQETIDAAIAAPRVHHQWSPDLLQVERSWEDSVVKALRSRGHEFAERRDVAIAQGIEATAGGQWRAAADPRGA